MRFDPLRAPFLPPTSSIRSYVQSGSAISARPGAKRRLLGQSCLFPLRLRVRRRCAGQSAAGPAGDDGSQPLSSRPARGIPDRQGHSSIIHVAVPLPFAAQLPDQRVCAACDRLRVTRNSFPIELWIYAPADELFGSSRAPCTGRTAQANRCQSPSAPPPCAPAAGRAGHQDRPRQSSSSGGAGSVVSAAALPAGSIGDPSVQPSDTDRADSASSRLASPPTDSSTVPASKSMTIDMLSPL